MYSGLLPKGLTEADLSSDGDDDQEDTEDREHHGDDDQDTEDREHHGDDDQEDTEDREHHGDDDQEDPEDREHHGGTNNNHNSGDADSSQTPTVQQHESCSLPGISQETWQKFKELQKKKNEIKETKDFKRRRRRHKKGAINKDATEERAHQTEPEKHWDELKQYFGVNDRFQPPACSKPPPKSGLEKSIDSAIAEGDVAKAEEMSDRLATRELGVKIAQAADCRDYVEHKKEEEASRAAQKRKNQITWGFEAKRRWETKSNMGYM